MLLKHILKKIINKKLNLKMSNQKKLEEKLDLQHKKRLSRVAYNLHFVRGWTYSDIAELFGYKNSCNARDLAVDYKYKNQL